MRLPVAAIDFGTNTARLLIGFHEDSGAIAPVVIRRQITRLGGGFTSEAGISAEARERAMATMDDFAEEIVRHGVGKVRAVATSAVRDAVNGHSLCAAIHRRCGISLEVIDGYEEACLTLRGVLSAVDTGSPELVVFDVGGGSTEYTIARGTEAVFTRSLSLGVVRLTEGKGTVAAMEDKINRELAIFAEEVADNGQVEAMTRSTLVGTAGTATTLAAISMGMTDYDYRRVNNYLLSLEQIRDIFALLLPLKPEERLKIPGLERGREDLIIAGILMTIKTMERFGFESLRVSDGGLLEGVFLSI